MTSPQSPYPHGAHGPGPSYYHQPPPVYGSSSPGPNPHYAYQYPPPPPQHHHPGPSRPNGRGGASYNSRNQSHNPYAYYPPYGHHPGPMPMQHHPYPRSQPYSQGYFLNPAAAPFTPPPRHTPQPPASPAAAKRPQSGYIEPTEFSPASTAPNPILPPRVQKPTVQPRVSTPPAPQSEEVLNPPAPSALPAPEFLASKSQASERAESSAFVPSPTVESTPQDFHFGDPTSSDSTISFAIWSRRPSDPSQAPGIIISTKARPPANVVEGALDTHTPPISPPPSPKKPLRVVSESVDISQTNSTAPSSAVTENADTPTVPGSPATTNTSVSTSAAAAPKEEAVEPTPVEEPTPSTPIVLVDETPSVPTEASTPTPALTDEASAPSSAAPAPPAAPPVKKSWASLLRPAGSSAASPIVKNALPTSSIVGFSIPADAASASPAVSPTKKSELVNLLSGSAPAASFVPDIRPRGLVNNGNMCFANAVLQILVYCPPFHKLFAELGKLLTAEKAEKESATWAGPPSTAAVDSLVPIATPKQSSATPLVDATAQFLKEFIVKKKKPAVNGKNTNGASGSGGYTYGRGGKGKERDFEMDDDSWDMDSFLPTYIYDAMKEKKRFDAMGGGQQEDAEEFLGFYLDTLEEELLLLLNNVNAAEHAKADAEEQEALASQGDGWMEVGKKNRSVVTRTIKATESPITRIFGGKFRSTLRAPRQKDSVVVEDWRSLRLDIQRDQIKTIQDALSHISHPQPVQVSIPTLPGVSVEATQQVLIESLPPILVLHMKRFCYDTTVKGVVKVGKQVAFGPELEIGPELMAPAAKKPGSGPTRYKLFGALYHHGLSASGGHYTLDVLHPNRYPNAVSTKPLEGWVRIDDDLVSDVRPDDVFGAAQERDDSRCAYLLFYKRMA